MLTFFCGVFVGVAAGYFLGGTLGEWTEEERCTKTADEIIRKVNEEGVDHANQIIERR